MKKHISYSQINMFLRCPRQYEFRYIEGMTIPPSGALLQGRIGHEAVEENYRQKIDSHEDLPVGDLKEFFAARFDEIVEAEGEVLYGEGEDRGTLKDQGVGLVEAHRSAIAPEVQPVAVEEGFSLSMTEGLDLVGYWDVIDNRRFILDNKFVGRAIPQSDADKDLQLSIYALAHRAVFGEPESGLGLDCVVKNKKPKAVRVSTERTAADCEWTLDLMDKVVQAIRTGIFYPNDRGWHCSPKWCGYYERCRGRGGK